MLKRIIGLLFFIVIFTSCGKVAQPATIVDTPVKSYSPEERAYIVEAYREAYLNAIRETAGLKAFVFPLLKEAAQIAMAIPEKEVSKKFRPYEFRTDYGMYVIGRHLIDDYSQESLDAWKAIGVSPKDPFQRVFQVYKGSAAERAGFSAGDSTFAGGDRGERIAVLSESDPSFTAGDSIDVRSFLINLFVNHKGEIYLSQNQQEVRRRYMRVYGNCDKRTGELLDVSLLQNDEYKRHRVTSGLSLEPVNIYERPFFRTSQNQLYCTSDKNNRLLIRLKPFIALSPDTLIHVPVGIDNKNPRSAYCSTDRIVIGSDWITEQPDYGAFVFAHELAHFIMGDVNVMIHNIKVKQDREAFLSALKGAVAGAITGVVDNKIAGYTGDKAAGNMRSHIASGVTWGALYGSRVGAYLGRLLYSHEMEANADKIALYILARAGYNLENVRDFWKDHAPYLGYSREGASHPSPKNRDIAMAKTIAEIRLKQRKGIELLPTYH